MKFLYWFLIILGIILYAYGAYLIWERNSPDRLSFSNYKIDYKQIETGSDINNPPVRILIKDLNIDLPLIPSHINNNKWESTTQGASLLASSAIPGDIGNSIIYTHDWASLFGPLKNAVNGQIVEIIFKDGSKKQFAVKDIKEVSPKQTDILNNFGDKRLTLYTCAGFLDSRRLVVTALLVDDKLMVNK